MRCFYCIQEAEFKCEWQQAYMCESHTGTHMKTTGKHEIEVLDIDLEQPRLQKLKSETLKRIQKINEAEKLILYTTESLIKTIEKAYKEAIKRLDNFRKNYFEILEHKKFCISELPIIEKIEKMELEVQNVEIDKLMIQISGVYGAELINYLERGNSYIEMSLKEKIDYYYPIVLNIIIGWDLNSCHQCGKELLVSNDRKYLFFCKLHLGI